ncbi:MAG: class I SAM-dependent methyltransferase [Chloroflexi bacterium]|nr:class I SAM-dependent methyltransferase [Chloroflexota bacterium]
MYDEFSTHYDRFVNWQSRLAYEMPFLEQQMRRSGSGGGFRVLDSACGTGMHTIELARRGYAAAGADLSAKMIERARENAVSTGVAARFEAAGFGQLQAAFGAEAFDVLLCMGNSLPHVLSAPELAAALDDFAACLRPGGLLLVQNRNFDAVLESRQRWMEPQSFREGEREWVFVRFYDFEPDGKIAFNILTLERSPQGDWSQQLTTTWLWPQRESELLSALAAAGFGEVIRYGDMQGAPFDPQTSPNLILTARKG